MDINTDNILQHYRGATTGGLLRDYAEAVLSCEQHIQGLSDNVADRLRTLLVPILHRYGMGMLNGGALVYLDPSPTRQREGAEVYTNKECDVHLGLLHEELMSALWTQVEVFPYEDTFHDLVQDISLPEGVEYLWVVEKAGVNIMGRQQSQLSTMSYKDSLETYLQRDGAVYYGPITREYLDDVADYVEANSDSALSEFLVVLPAYIVGDDQRFVAI